MVTYNDALGPIDVIMNLCVCGSVSNGNRMIITHFNVKLYLKCECDNASSQAVEKSLSDDEVIGKAHDLFMETCRAWHLLTSAVNWC